MEYLRVVSVSWTRSINVGFDSILGARADSGQFPIARMGEGGGSYKCYQYVPSKLPCCEVVGYHCHQRYLAHELDQSMLALTATSSFIRKITIGCRFVFRGLRSWEFGIIVSVNGSREISTSFTELEMSSKVAWEYYLFWSLQEEDP